MNKPSFEFSSTAPDKLPKVAARRSSLAPQSPQQWSVTILAGDVRYSRKASLDSKLSLVGNIVESTQSTPVFPRGRAAKPSLPSHVFKNLPREIYACIAKQVAMSQAYSECCRSCVLRDICSLALTSRAWEKVVRYEL
jgi:hypothetical protein